MRAFVTGGAGFVGSNLVDRLLLEHEVIAYDNLSTGRESFLQSARMSNRFSLVRGDVLDLPHLTKSMRGSDVVFHLSANADVRFGLDHPRKDLEQNTVGTFNVLEAMRDNHVKRIVFASTGSVYGQASVFPTPENAPFPVQTSLYGASKLACEALIQAYCTGFGFQSWIFRFVGILGERYTHGHVIDFFRKLQADPTELEILGDGHQKKSYLYVQDCIDGMLCALARSHEPINLFNLGTDEYCEVDDSVGWICQCLKVSPTLKHKGGVEGWVGDNPFIFLDASRIKALGWRAKLSIKEAVGKTVEYLFSNREVLADR